MHHTQSTSPTTEKTLPISPQNPNAHPSHIRKYSDIFGIFGISRSSSDSEIFGNIRKHSFPNERETLFLLILCVIALHTHRYHPPKFRRNPEHHDIVVILPILHMLACCLLLLAKPGRSTLDTKEGYKTKTGSTSSVTLTRTPGRTRERRHLHTPAFIANQSGRAVLFLGPENALTLSEATHLQWSAHRGLW